MAETLISPGVLARENDQSQITSQPVQAGACIVGPTVLGKANIPKMVTSYSEYLANFGSTFTSGSDTYTYFTSISAYNYFNNGGTSLIVSRVVSGSFTAATSSAVRNEVESGILQDSFNMSGSITGATGGTAGVVVTAGAASSQTGTGTGATFDYTVSQDLGKLIASDNVLGELTTNTTVAGAASYTDVAVTSNLVGTGATFDVTVAGTTAPAITAITVDATSVGSGYVAGEVLTIAAGALGTGQLINAQNILSISSGLTGFGNTTGPFTKPQSSTSGAGAGASVTITGDGAGNVSAITVLNIGTGYVAGNTITISTADLNNGAIGTGAFASTQDIVITLTSTQLQNSSACVLTLGAASGGQTRGPNVAFGVTSLVTAVAGTGYAVGNALTFTGAAAVGTGNSDLVLTLQDADLLDAEAFVLETLTDGVVMNSNDASGSNGTLTNGTTDNVRWEIQGRNEAQGTFSVIVRQGNDTATAKRVLEIFPNVSLDPNQSNYISRIIGDMTDTRRGSGADLYIQSTGSFANASRFIRVKQVNYKTPDYFDNNGAAKAAFKPYLPDNASGSFGGAEGRIFNGASARYYDEILDTNTQGFASTEMAAYTDAFNLLANKDDYKYNIITAPGLYYAASMMATPLNTLVQNTQTRGDAIAIIDLVDYESSVTQVTAQAASIDNSYAASYWPWVQIMDPDSRRLVWSVPSAMIPGVYAYNDKTSEAWFAPAGINRGGLSTVVQAERKLTQTNRDDLYTGKVNPIATFPGKGVVVFGQKTLQSQASALDRINVRRLLIALKNYIVQIADNLVFEQNTAATRNNFLAQVNPYLESVQQRQGLFAFKVVMDASNNGPDVVDRNQMVGAIYVQPTRTAEFIYLDFNILPTGAQFPS
tara:strand:+ start:1062 stop:3704 length:2643 start_codon:yes stop_codon:yes gene_type:complete